MRIAGIINDDIVDSDDGIAVSLWTVGCPHHCKGCHNQNLWDYDAGIEIPNGEVLRLLKEAITKNGFTRNFSILGGEPLDPQNVEDVTEIVKEIKTAYPDIKIYLWTGYTMEELGEREDVKEILRNISVLIEGRYIEELRADLPLRGSSNQRIYIHGSDLQFWTAADKKPCLK